MEKFQVFLSFKNTDGNGNITKDRGMAEKLYSILQGNGIKTFFSEATLGILGVAQYKEAIDAALDSAKILIVVGTSIQNITSNWVRYEWDSFYGDVLSGKKDGKLFSYVDGIGVNDLPRSLRQSQSFDAEKWSLENIKDYILNALKVNDHESKNLCINETVSYKKHSAYSAVAGEEPKRLITQADRLYKNDLCFITPIMQKQFNDRKLDILDIGCADGYLTKKLFSNFLDSINVVVGIDHESACINKASDLSSHPFNFYCVDVESEKFEKDMELLMAEQGIDAFDFVYSALVFHHLDDPTKVLRKLRKFIKKGGCLYIRSCDDSENVAYPDKENTIRNLIEYCGEMPGMSDRHHGRRLYYELYNSGYNDISIEHGRISTIGMNIDERIQYCKEAFFWPRFRYKKLIDENPEVMEYLIQYNRFCSDYEKIEEMFYDPSFYFETVSPIAIAWK